MKININKNIHFNNITKKEILIGCVATATVTTIALACYKATKKKREVTIPHKDEDFSDLIDELENISNKIVDISRTQEQLDNLLKEKAILKDNFILKPY